MPVWLEIKAHKFSNFQPFISSLDQGLIMPGTPGQERATMTAKISRQGFGTDEEFFRFHFGSHGRDRSLSSLWQILNGAAPMQLPAVSEDLLFEL
jgi:hypothetical protein